MVRLAAPASAQTFVNIRSQDAPKYDPHNNTSSGMGHPMFMMGDTLVALDWDLKTVHPLLAKSWDVSDDRLTYTFRLRDDVTFCSGKKFTAADVVYSFNRLADPDGQVAVLLAAGRDRQHRAPTIPTRVVYKLKRPHSELLVDLTNFAATIINKDNVEALGADFGVKGFDGTGPLCWEKWEPRKELVLKRHDAYKWGPTGVYNKGPVKYERMIWRIVPEETTRIATMIAGQADFCHWNPLQAIETFRKAPNLAVYEPTADFAHVLLGLEERRART